MGAFEQAAEARMAAAKAAAPTKTPTPGEASSARYQAQADKYFAPGGPGENIDIFTGAKKTVTTSGLTPEQIKEAAEKADKALKELRESYVSELFKFKS
jgi:hypothetical protein